jgi:hypothetical protein
LHWANERDSTATYRNAHTFANGYCDSLSHRNSFAVGNAESDGNALEHNYKNEHAHAD